MLVLAVDTALQRCSIAIVQDGDVLVHQSLDIEKGHAEHIGEMARLALDEVNVSVKDVNRIGVTVGPGGFTGVRVGLSFARGLAIGTDVAVIGVTSLAALAGADINAPAGVLIAPVIDARRDQVYAGLYDELGGELVAPFLASPRTAQEILVEKSGGQPVAIIGSGRRLIDTATPSWSSVDGFAPMDAEVVARIAAKAEATGGPPAPLYLRGPDAKPPKPSPFQQQTV